MGVEVEGFSVGVDDGDGVGSREGSVEGKLEGLDDGDELGVEEGGMEGLRLGTGVRWWRDCTRG